MAPSSSSTAADGSNVSSPVARAASCSPISFSTGTGRLPAAVRAGRQLIQVAPLRESGYRLLMRALARQGNPAEALRVYSLLCDTLRDELGVSPSAAARSLHEELLLD